jgi:UDP-N-acetyl-D-glucosamine dehydrogenase
MSVIEKIYAGSASVGVIGLGYVGLAEAIEFTKARFRVTGFEIDESRVAAIAEGRSYIVDVSNEDLRHAVRTGLLTATSDMTRLGDMDAILICVPTPLGKTKAPDLSHIMSAVEAIRPNLRSGQLVVLESTTYPGTTTEVVRPALEASGLGAGYDFHLCFAPERINPGDHEHPASKIPRIVGGLTPECAEAARLLYARIAPEVVVVSSPEAAEMVKLLENTFRAVNIGLVNELALMCRSLGIDVWEIISAAATKPFGFMPFYPGPGLGGHCIPIDPLYLSWKARVNGFDPRFIELAHQVNSAMPRFVVTLVTDALNQAAMAVKGATILVLGVSYKPDVNDARESPATSVIAELWQRGATVFYHDPHVPVLEVHGQWIRSVPLEDYFLTNADCVVILTHHSGVDYERVLERATRIVDTRNVTRRHPQHHRKVVYL